MRLGINGWRLHGPRTGVRRYILNVVRHWTAEAAGRFEEITLYTPAKIDREEVPLPENVRERVLLPRWPMLAWENLCLAPVAMEEVLFCPSYSRPLLARGRTVVTTHDAVLHLFPELFPLSARLFYDRLYGWSARHAALVITDSEAGRQDVARCYGVPPARIRVVYLAPSEVFRPRHADPRLSEVRRRLVGSEAPFFLFVGKMAGRRSIPVMLEGFAQLRQRTSHAHRLVLVGLNTRGLDLADLAARLGLSDRIVHHAFVPDEDLSLLYGAADALVSPSLYETVSLPVMEAQASGAAVICVDTAGMREITGGAALLMGRTDVPEMFAAMSRLAGDAALRRELSERGLESARRFSWRRCSAETLDVLEEAARLEAPAAA